MIRDVLSIIGVVYKSYPQIVDRIDEFVDKPVDKPGKYKKRVE
jgi:hypothetical protein